MSIEKFWLEQPSSLGKQLTILPTPTMSVGQRLNALTRLIIVISLILWLFRFARWWLFLILGLGLVIILYYTQPDYTKTTSTIENYVRPIQKRKNSQGSRIKPNYFQPYT